MARETIVTVGRGGRHWTVRGDTMDTMASVRTSTFSTPKRRAETPDYSTNQEYAGRHVLWTADAVPAGVHPRGQGFRILSRLARSKSTAA
jgi:hypothetical protein